MNQRVPSQEATLPAAAQLFADTAVFPDTLTTPVAIEAHSRSIPSPASVASANAPTEEELMTLSIADHRDFLDWQENQGEASTMSDGRWMFGLFGVMVGLVTLFAWIR